MKMFITKIWLNLFHKSHFYSNAYFLSVWFYFFILSGRNFFQFIFCKQKEKQHEVTNCSINRIDQQLWSFCQTYVFPPGGFGLLGLQILQGLVGVSRFSRGLCRYLFVRVIGPAVVCRSRGNLGVHVASLLRWTPCGPLRGLVQRVGPQHLHLVALLLWPAQPHCVSGFLEGVGVTGGPLQRSGRVRWWWGEGGRTEPVGVLLLLLLVVESGQRSTPALHLCQLRVCDAWWTQITWVARVSAVKRVRHQPCVLSGPLWSV